MRCSLPVSCQDFGAESSSAHWLLWVVRPCLPSPDPGCFCLGTQQVSVLGWGLPFLAPRWGWGLCAVVCQLSFFVEAPLQSLQTERLPGGT